MESKQQKLEAQSITVSVGGKEISFETGKIARQAGGSVMIRSGDTMLLSTACMGAPLDLSLIHI